MNPLYSTDYLFRDIYMIATAAENEKSTFEKAYKGLQSWVDRFEKTSLKSMVGWLRRLTTTPQMKNQTSQYSSYLIFAVPDVR